MDAVSCPQLPWTVSWVADKERKRKKENKKGKKEKKGKKKKV